MAADETLLEKILDEWETLREGGRTPSVDELCRDCPELLPLVREHVGRLLAIEPLLQLWTDPSDRAIPEWIGSYRVLEEISRGGMGVVFRCEQASPRREVAVKVIHAWRADAKGVRRFLREAHVLGLFHDIGIAQVFEASTADIGMGQQPYLAMELIAGLPLDRYADAHRLDVRQRLQLFVKICSAVQHAHEHGVIHRDLKPANILVENSGQPKIIDFGVALLTSSELNTWTTLDGGMLPIGSVTYMSPEQTFADANYIDSRSDVYALGVILYEFLAGQSPYRQQGGTVYERIAAVREEVPPLLGSVNKSFRGDLETIVAKALEKDRDRRYESAAALAADLTRYLNAEPIMARRVGAIGRVFRWCRRKPLAASLAVATFLAAGSVLAALYFADLARDTTRIADSHAEEVERQTNLREREKLEARRAAYNSQLLRASQVMRSDPALGQALLENEEHCPPEWRGFTWHLLHRGCRRERLTIDAHGDPVDYVALLSDGRTLATASTSHRVKFWNLETGEQQRAVADNWNNRFFMGLSADGTKIAWVKNNSISVRDTNSGNELVLLDGHDGRIRAAAFTLDNNLLVSVSNDQTLRIWDLASGQERAVLLGHESRVRCVAISADGKTLASGDGNGTVKTWSVASHQQLTSLDAHTGDVLRVSLSPDGRVVASCGADDTAAIWDVGSGQRLASLPTNNHTVHAIVFSEDGQTLAFAGTDRDIRLWDLKQQVVKTVLRASQGPIHSLSFSRDGTTLASGGYDQSVKLWDVRTQLAAHTLRGHESNVTCVACSPDGTWLASGGRDSTVRLWNAKSGAHQRTLAGHMERISAVAFSPDGHTLAAADGRGAVVLWDHVTGEIAASREGQSKRVEFLAFSPDGGTLASCGADGMVHLWDWKSGGLARDLPGHGSLVSCVVFSHNGRILASAGRDRSIRFWDARTGQPLNTLAGHSDRIEHIAFSNDDSTLASASADRTIKLWNVERGTLSLTLSGHTNSVMSVAYCPVGQTLASASEDHSIKLWDSESGQIQATLDGHTDWVRSLAFSPSGESLFSASNDGTIRVWEGGRQTHGTEE